MELSQTLSQADAIKRWLMAKGVDVDEVSIQEFDFARNVGVMVKTKEGWCEAVQQAIPYAATPGQRFDTIVAMCEMLHESWKWRNNKRPKKPPELSSVNDWAQIGEAWGIWKKMRVA